MLLLEIWPLKLNIEQLLTKEFVILHCQSYGLNNS